jgi:DNA-binding PadR family transcriptional regulator
VPTTDEPLNATAATLLGFLHEGPMTGFTLAKKAQEVTGEFWNVTRSQVYRELKVLAERGLVSMQATGPRDRQPYALTRAGRASFAAWIAEPPGPLVMRFPIALTVFFGRHLPPAKLREFVAAHRAHHAERLAECRALVPVVGADPHTVDVLRLGVGFHEAVIAWLDGVGAPAKVGKGERRKSK